jgi:TolB protein
MKGKLVALTIAVSLLAVWTGTPTQAAQPGNSQSSGTILFTSNELSWDDLYTMDEQGGNIKRLTTIGRVGAGNCWQFGKRGSWACSAGAAHYSPDGTRIAFSRVETDRPAYNTEIYVMNADGSGLKNITNSSDFLEWSPDWSADGTRIVYVGRRNVDQESHLYVMDADGNHRSPLAYINNANFDPAWSPDGKQIAFVSYFGGYGGRSTDQADIGVISADGSDLVRLTYRGDHFSLPVWAPSGQELVYSWRTRDQSTGETWQVWRMKADGGNQRCIIGCKGWFSKFSNYPVAWKGNRILFAAWENGNWDIYIANDNGTGAVKLTSQPWDQKVQDWKP